MEIFGSIFLIIVFFILSVVLYRWIFRIDKIVKELERNNNEISLTNKLLRQNTKILHHILIKIKKLDKKFLNYKNDNR